MTTMLQQIAERSTRSDVMSRLAAAIGSEYVSTRQADLHRAATATYATTARPCVIARPATHAEVRDCLTIARETQLAVHPVSSGLNWGFGSRVPHEDGSILLQLDRMKTIELSEPLRRVTLGPGVTQRELFDHLAGRDAGLMVPLSGSLPDSSIVANAAAGGTSNGRHVVRWDHVLSLKGVLYSGEEIRTGFTRVSDSSRVRATRYSVGPDLSGLFRDSDLGVITELTLELPPFPELMQVYFFAIPDESRMPAVVDALTALKDDGLICGEWFLLHGWRVLAESLGRYPWDATGGRTPLRRDAMLEHLAAERIPIWNGLFNGAFATYLPSPRMARAVRGDITDRLAALVPELRCVELDHATLMRLRADPDAPIAGVEHNALRARVRTFAGIPKQGYVSIGYWRKKASTATAADFDGDRCGFLWLDCASPASGDDALQYSRIIERVFGDHGFEPMVVVDSVRDRELYLLASLVYDRDIPGEDERAMACFEEAVAALGDRDLHPFRFPVGLRHLLPPALDDSAQVMDRLRGVPA
jgi:4-cresol dehydrogenase (hydroxylating)